MEQLFGSLTLEEETLLEASPQQQKRQPARPTGAGLSSQGTATEETNQSGADSTHCALSHLVT